MLMAMLYLYLSGGANSWLVYDISDPVKQYVVVAETREQVIALNEQMLKEEAAFTQESGKFKRQLATINSNRLATASEFAEVFAALDAQRDAARERILDRRFKMRALMSAEEWQNVYAAVSPQ
jgi:hypothetical protein